MTIAKAIIAVSMAIVAAIGLWMRCFSRRSKIEKLRKELEKVRIKMRLHKVGSYHYVVLDDKRMRINKAIRNLQR